MQLFRLAPSLGVNEMGPSIMCPHSPFFNMTLAFILAFTSAVIAQICYYPDGITEALSDRPCNVLASGQGSTCCKAAAICLDNGLCYNQQSTGLMERGTCTDKTWGSPHCPKICPESEPVLPIFRPLFGWIRNHYCHFILLIPYHDVCSLLARRAELDTSQHIWRFSPILL